VPVTVVIDLPEADKSSPEASFLLESCSGAIPRGTCAFDADSTTTARAIVRFEGGDAHIGVSVVGQAAHQRQIQFEEQDPRAERFRAIGLVIATLYGEAIAPPAPSPPVVPPPNKKPFDKLAVQAGVVIGSGLDTGGVRAGPWLDVALRPWRIPIAAVIGTSVALRGRDQKIQPLWFEVDLGPRIIFPMWSQFWIETRPSFVLGYFDVAANDADLSDRASRWTAGGALDVDFVLSNGFVALVLRARGAISQATSIHVQNVEIAKDPGVAFLGMLGFRIALWR